MSDIGWDENVPEALADLKVRPALVLKKESGEWALIVEKWQN